MNFFGALTACYFKIGSDGRRLYYPWGFWGRGYAISSESDYQRLRQQLTIYQVATLVLVVGAVVVDRYIVACVIGALCMLFYAVWSRSLRAGLQGTDQRMSLRESFISQANAYSALTLWLLIIGALAFVAMGVMLLIFDNEGRLMTLLAIVFFGLCAASGIYMMLLRQRTGRPAG